jgi:hypothetical protein
MKSYRLINPDSAAPVVLEGGDCMSIIAERPVL